MKKLLRDCSAKEILMNWENNYKVNKDKKFLLNIPIIIHNTYDKYKGKIDLENVYRMIKPYLTKEAEEFEFEVGDEK